MHGVVLVIPDVGIGEVVHDVFKIVTEALTIPD
jgi:hypothetical protein